MFLYVILFTIFLDSVIITLLGQFSGKMYIYKLGETEELQTDQQEYFCKFQCFKVAEKVSSKQF